MTGNLVKDCFISDLSKARIQTTYMPVTVLAFLRSTNEKGVADLDSIADYFIMFYSKRKEAGLDVERSDSIFAKSTPTKKDVKTLILFVTHKPGDTMQVDWAGGTIPYYDSVTGEEYKAYLFVAALPCSSYLYVEACTDMKQENWLMCHVHAYEYFGGVTRVLVPDNLKTGVTANTRYETQLNESYRELAEYYGTAIVPARVRKPQDKGLVERSVGFSTTWITAALRERKFFSFAEVRDAVAERLEFINTKPFQKRPGSRREAYLSEKRNSCCRCLSTLMSPLCGSSRQSEMTI